ncbi:four helix bundle protein [Flavobacterium oreochromis]|uniref:four helix bundle protein n=1 Tax=Flavobacterium oreochromis TaxID=2906078 RepID=UPI00385897BA
MGNINSYQDLLVWQKGIVLVIKIYQLLKTFPQEELYALISQIKRAVVSIPSNITEGYGRNTDKSFSHFIDIPRDSLYELEI